MNPQAAQPTDQQLDQIIDQQREALRNIYRAILAGQQPWGGVKLLDMPLPSGQTWGIYVYIMNEPFATLIGGTLQGMAHMEGAMRKVVAQAPKPAAAPAPDPAANPFGM